MKSILRPLLWSCLLTVVSAQTAPTLTSQPGSQSVTVGTDVTLTVVATGSPPPTFQWRKGGVVIPGATASGLTLSNVQGVTAGSYDVVVTNAGGSVVSSTVALTVNPEVILSSAARQVVPTNTAWSLSAAVAGATSLQWFRNGLPLTGATTATLTRASATSHGDSGWYHLEAVNTAGGTGVTDGKTMSRTVFVTVAPLRTDLLGAGINNYGQLSVPAGLTDAVAVSAGGYHGLSLRADGTVLGWGINNFGQTTIPAGLVDVVAVAAGYQHSLALKADGTVAFWGHAGDGQGPVPSGVSGVVAIAAGHAHNLALLRDGSVVAWGGLGVHSHNQSVVPAGLGQVVAVAAGKYHSVALKADGTVVAWGLNHVGQTNIPAGLGGVVAIAAGGYHTLALKSDGTVVGWGWNEQGQSTVPATLANVVAVGAGSAHSIALRADGTVVGWGSNAQGELTLPSQTSAVTALAAGQEFSLVLAANPATPLAPSILVQPQGGTTMAGQGFRLSAVAAGDAPLTFQWRKDGVTLAGATSSHFQIPSAQLADAGSYNVVVANAAGTVSSVEAALTVKHPQTISFPEITGKTFGDGPFTLVASASSGLPVSFQVISGPATLNGGMLSLTGAGEVSVRASQSGDAGFTAAPEVTRVFNVAKGIPVLTWFTPAPIAQGTALGATQLNALSSIAGSFDYAPAAGTLLAIGQHTLEARFTPASPANFQSASATVTILIIAPSAPSITAQPQPQLLTAPGAAATFGVVASGSPPLTYQWARNGAPIAGATNATLTLANVQPSAVGTYSVKVTNAVGSVRSMGAALDIRQTGHAAFHAAPLGGYVAGQGITITSTLSYAGTPSALSWSVLLPPGWSFGAASNTGSVVAPVAGQTEVIDWAWSEIPTSPVSFSFTLNVPAGQTGAAELVALAGVRGTVTQQFVARPDALVLNHIPFHLADTDRNSRISLLELTRVIELYNTRAGSVRTGAYAAATEATEDGFMTTPQRAAGTEVSISPYHSADSDRDGRIGLLELTRVIELYNYRSAGARTGQYRVQVGTEDGFAPGL